jgi:uncharacterized protein (TIGR02996 family)
VGDEAALLRAVQSDPGDDNPRLVLADWYDEHGDPARAEFIRVQCEYARLGRDDPRRGPLHERQAGLLADHRRAWLPPGWSFHDYPPETWRRGFVSRVDTQQARVTSEDGVSLAAVPTLESLSFARTGVTDAEFRYLPPLPNLREFCLWGGEELTDASFARLDQWPALDTLGLLATGLTNRALARVAALGGLRSLMVVDGLSSEALTDEGFAHIAGMTNLAELTFGAEGVTGRGLAVLADLPRLRKLMVGGCALTEDAIPPLVRCRGLEELGLNDWRIGGSGDRLLTALPQLTSLRALHAIRHDVTADGFLALGQLTELEELAVGGSAFGDRELAHLLGLRGLRRLQLHANGFTRAGLAGLGTLPGLRALDLLNCNLRDESVGALGELRQLRWLELGGNATDASLGHIADLPLLEVLRFNSPFVTDAGLAQLKRLPRLRCLLAEGCGVTKEFAWSRRAEWAPHLESLCLNGRTVGPTEWLSEGWRMY